jgi:hypothetical protein
VLAGCRQGGGRGGGLRRRAGPRGSADMGLSK